MTGADVSNVALALGAERAAAAGPEVAQRISWEQVDFLSWDPGLLQLDLVSAQFMHLPAEALESLYRRLTAAVRPDGTILVVLHHPSDLSTSVGRWGQEEMFRTPDEVVAALGPEWEIEVAAAPQREAVDPDGQPVMIRDTLVRGLRRS